MQESKSKRKSAGIVYEKNDLKKQASILSFFKKNEFPDVKNKKDLFSSPSSSAARVIDKKIKTEEDDCAKSEEKKESRKSQEENEGDKYNTGMCEVKPNNKISGDDNLQNILTPKSNSLKDNEDKMIKSEDIIKQKRIKLKHVLFDSEDEEYEEENLNKENNMNSENKETEYDDYVDEIISENNNEIKNNNNKKNNDDKNNNAQKIKKKKEASFNRSVNTDFDDKNITVDEEDKSLDDELEVKNKKKRNIDSLKYAEFDISEKKEDAKFKQVQERNCFEKKKRLSFTSNNTDISSLKASNINPNNENLFESYAATHPQFSEYLNVFYTYSRIYSFPKWLDPNYIRDKYGLRPFDKNYDFTTMWIPTPNHQWAIAEKNHYTPGMQQYWEIKQDNFDKIVLFKMGRFYEIFYIDACIAQGICDLRWMGGVGEQKPHIGFPEQSLHFHAKNLVDFGHKVVVVEQMETPKELEERNKKTTGQKDKAVRRELCEVYTQGTLVHGDMLSPESKYLLAIYFEPCKIKKDVEECEEVENVFNIGICYVDVAICNIHVGNILDDSSRQAFKTILAQIIPAEVIYSPSNIPQDALKILKALPNSPQLSSMLNFPQALAAKEEIERYFPCDDGNALPENLELCREKDSTLCAFGAVCVYLRSLLLDKKVLTFSQFHVYEPSSANRVILDSSSLTNLEIFQTQEGKSENSLFAFLNHTSTTIGSRLFKLWLCSPLCNEDDINTRLDVVEWLIENHDLCSKIRQKFSKFPDVERLMARVCSQGLQGERGAVYFENIQNQRLSEFIALLKAFEEMQNVLKCFQENDDFPSNRLGDLTKLQSEGGLFPNLYDINQSLINKVVLTENKEWKPCRGADEEYDNVNLRVEKIKEKLNNELKKISKLWNVQGLKFVHTKYKYEVECPDDIRKSLQQQVDITSTRKGFIRFHTEEIKVLVEELEYEEQALKDAIYPFMQKLFRELYTFYDHYQAAIRIIAEIDVYLSFALVATNTSNGPMCRPKFVLRNENEKPTLYLKNCRHPVAASLLPNFISNDTTLNYRDVNSSVLLVTGPNMGGKSTVLRQNCIAIIMAQIGCYVPAEECILTCVDKIFTRIGARDSILEGKSTFFVELEETRAILTQSTRYSFAVIDELGRGTSTFDGTAIALAALEYISLVLNCRCLFSTHFHLLCEEFRGISNIQNFHMAADIDNDGGVTFLYKFVPGNCAKSHGLHVAKFAGLAKEVIDCAAEKSRELESVTNDFYVLTRCRTVARQILKLVECGNQEKLNKFIEDECSDICSFLNDEE